MAEKRAACAMIQQAGTVAQQRWFIGDRLGKLSGAYQIEGASYSSKLSSLKERPSMQQFSTVVDFEAVKASNPNSFQSRRFRKHHIFCFTR